MRTHANPNTSRYLELDALQEAVRWPTVERRTIVVLAGQLLATRQFQRGYAFFRERAAAQPNEPLLLALEGVFQARLAGRKPLFRRPAWIRDAVGKLDRAVAREPGLTTYFRGLVLAELPAMLGKAGAAVADLEWVLAHMNAFPTAIRRSVYRALARAYTAQGRGAEAHEALQRSGYASLEPGEPQFVTDAWLTAADGYRFVAPRLIEPSPGIYVAQGYDFSDFAFIATGDGLVAIDAGTTPARAQAALDDLRRRTDAPIRHVILTHAHWDLIGGLSAFAPPGVQVIASANFADELRIVNETGGRLGAFFGRDDRHDYALAPDRLVAEPETLTLGGVQFTLYPAHGGETNDALLVHLPSAGVLFVGDVLMPEFGAPFLPEGSAEGLFDTLALIQRLAPRLLIHGHTALTENIGSETLPGLDAALREVYAQVMRAIREGKTLVEILEDNPLPGSLRSHPGVVVPFVVMRDGFIERLYHQRTGYWQPDGEGMEPVSPAEWAAALDLLAGGKERAFVRSARVLLSRGNAALALKLIDLGRQRHPASKTLARLRRQALDRLRERYHQLNPFKFIVYSGLAGAELLPLPDDVRQVAPAFAERELPQALAG
ncbi:MAG TPA: MBL fold metallo-hydrolase [Dehalococcoidia bacterium]|nr:MBL fold metallo-hydrolase [Dehalococcoidia bacterium]